jgi:hypothetical protein
LAPIVLRAAPNPDALNRASSETEKAFWSTTTAGLRSGIRTTMA